MKQIQLREGIWWVGGIDWDLRNFHGYLTQRGSSYNAYLIIDEKITLVDTVKHYLAEEMINRIKEIIDPAKIDYVVSNHVEMDHSGGIPAIMKYCPNAKIISSPKGVEGLKEHYGDQWNYQAIDNGGTLSLGKRSLSFVLTPMVHWPDNMVCYMPEEKILFSNDSFGQHIASSERFDDEYPLDITLEEARKYYANIVLPYSPQVVKELQAAAPLEIEMIAPSHGVIWRKHINTIVSEYEKWSAGKTEKKAVIVYDTMWDSTKKLAYTIQEAFEESGYSTVLCSLQQWHYSDVMTHLITAEYICVGSPTLNRNMLPSVASFLTYMKGLSPRHRKGFAFGSYGWGCMSVKQVEDNLKENAFDLLERIEVKFIPSPEKLQAIKEKLKKSLS